MPLGYQFSNLDYLRLFFTDDQEETAIMLARLFLDHLDDEDRLIRPEDTMEDLVGWDTKPVATIIAFLVAMEEEDVFPKEALSEVETFRELVEYVAARSGAELRPEIRVLVASHNSFTNL